MMMVSGLEDEMNFYYRRCVVMYREGESLEDEMNFYYRR